MKHGIIFIVIISFFNASAQDDFMTLKILEQLHLSEQQCKISLVTSKTLPNNPEETIYVIPEIVNDDSDYFELNSHILIVDTKTGQIKNHYFESSKTNAWYSDAVRLDKITIDTAPYDITANIRAFGIRIHYFGSSQPNPYSNETISLFIKKDNTLKQILKNFTVKEYTGEWDTNCYGEFMSEKKILILTKNKTNGYYNILVKNKIINTESDLDENDACIDVKNTVSTKATLKFNNTEYK